MNKHQVTLPATGYARLPTVLKVIPVGRSTWWEGIRQGRFPKGIKLSARTTVWKVEDIQNLILQIEQNGTGRF